MPGTGVSSTSLSPGPLAEGTDRVQLLGLPLDRCTRDQALDRCGLAAASHGPPLRVVTLNPEMVVRAGRDPALFDAIRGAGLVLPDGMGIAWAARRLGVEVPERIAGADFLPDLARLAAERGLGLFLLGGRPGVAAAAGQRLVRDHPGLRLVGAWPGSPAPAEATEICQRVEAAGAAVLAVAFGVPGQELWLARHLEQSGARVGIGVGGSLDYLAGRIPRAPGWLRRAGLEWSFRLLRQPWRLPRMLRAAPFFWRVWWSARPATSR